MFLAILIVIPDNHIPRIKAGIVTITICSIGFSKKECLDIVNDIIEIIIIGLINNGIVKIHNFGTFKLKRKKSRLGRNPKTREEFVINDRNVILFKASKKVLKNLNNF